MTPFTHLLRPRRALVTGAAALAFATGAFAGVAQADGFVINDPALAVPSNKIEHVVHETTIAGDFPRHTYDELYLGSDKAHWISRDVASGKVVSETAFDRGHAVTWDAKSNKLQTLDDKDTTPPWQSLAQEAANWQHTFATGASAQTGETTVNGRRALQLQSVPGKWKTDEPSGVTTMTVDAESFTLYEIKTVLAKYSFSQDVKLKSFETVARTAANESVFALLPKGAAAKAVAARNKAKAKAKAKKHHRR
ncbi:hypothetical protein DSM104299_01540 [Baekduia alba]|uniref:hypothetical protein n=1 Tax=Baekduia alba TaxID=2997333 RepID=UPI002341AC14|nr:hypothetical protein [Baekduia alba]WCB92840.1 hypothetical protein DSM104299_01540 [Baekduia alba]